MVNIFFLLRNSLLHKVSIKTAFIGTLKLNTDIHVF